MPPLTPPTLPLDTFCRKLEIPNSPEWLGSVNGALLSQMFASGWQVGDDGISEDEAAARWQRMVREFWASDGCNDEKINCRDFLPSAGIVTYAPNDPFLTPEYTPPGYSMPPYYANAGIPLPGVIPTDAMVNLLSPENLITIATDPGFPRFSMSVSGTGEVELEFVKIPQGGLMYIQAPDATVPLQIVELDSVSVFDVASLAFLLALLGLPGDYSVVNTEIIELHFETPGDHAVECTFLPQLGGEVILGFGGGLRRIGLCGLSATGENMYFRLRANPENNRLMEAQWSVDGDWELVLDNTCCDPAGGEGTQSRLNGDTYYYEISLDGGETWISDPTDPRLTGTQYPPLDPETENLKCQAATNAFQQFQNAYLECAIAFVSATTVVAAAAAIAAILAVIITRPTEAYKLIPIIMTRISAFIGSTAEAFTIDFATFADALFCAMFCNVKDDGTFDQAGFDEVIASVEGSTIGRLLSQIILYCWQVLGLTNAAKTPTGTAVDPSACEACDCGDCDTLEWELYDGTHGTGLTRGSDEGGDYIQVTSTTTPGGGDAQFVIITTHPGDLVNAWSEPCCILDHIEYVSETPEDTKIVNGIPCGLSHSGLTSFGDGDCGWFYQIQSNNSNFVAKIYVRNGGC